MAQPVLSPKAVEAFRRRIYDHYHTAGRHDLVWRHTRDPYAVLVSEVMLQQTQVSRVVPYYEEWLASFPTPAALDAAPLEAVLQLWQGLGYNRRAVALKRAAAQVVGSHGGEIPCERDTLLVLPGVGPATAAGVRVFAFGEPDLYLETNVRAVLLHEFFVDASDVPDSALMPVLERVLDRQDPRSWYWALLDYGVHLKSQGANPSRRSRHHVRQSRFEGSHRQLRARLLRAVMAAPQHGVEELAEGLRDEPDRVVLALGELVAEGFLAEEAGKYRVR
ncbi:MAG: A/G-specific adenine glycosylase [Coriobacteriia bacterium]|jgi:A/G-specific adenine glycosylase|nr:A/G-specific adenine glycosylase [Coriobacteriia bacterium]